MERMKYDVVILGAGPAGMTAAIYTTRYALKTALIAKEVGGQIAEADDVENYPGIDIIKGINLAMEMEKQAKKFGAEFYYDEIKSVKEEGNKFIVETYGGYIFEAKAIIIATGRHPRKLGVEGEEKLVGKGVSYCVTCDGPFFKNEEVVVVGGGNTAITGAEYLSKICKKVYIVHRRNEFRAEKILLERVKSKKNVEFLTPYVVTKILGENRVEGVEITNRENGEKKELNIRAVFVEIGAIPNTSFLQGFVEMNEKGEIKVDRLLRTSRPGVFAAGDVTDNRDKQVVIAAGEGAVAAISAMEYIRENKKE